jgi:hypothetical protein
MIPKKNWENFTEPDIAVSTATKSVEVGILPAGIALTA